MMEARNSAIDGQGRNRARVAMSFVVACIVASVTANRAEAAQYECAALRQDAGREEPRPDAPLSRRSDDTLQVVSPGETYYTSDDPAPDGSKWIELYGAQSQRGNSFVGFFQSGNFSCTPF